MCISVFPSNFSSNHHGFRTLVRGTEQFKNILSKNSPDPAHCIICGNMKDLGRYCRTVEGTYTCITVCKRCVTNLKKFPNKIIHTHNLWIWYDDGLKFQVSSKRAFIEFNPQERFKGKYGHYWVIEHGKAKYRKIR